MMTAASLVKNVVRRTFYRLPVAVHVHAAVRDGYNRARFGPSAPRFAERLWVDPSQVAQADRKGTEWRSAQVVSGPWQASRQVPILDDPIMQASIERWVDGRAWEDTGEIERMERAIDRLGPVSGCQSRDDILRRCDQLDSIFETIKQEGRLRAHGELHPKAFRERGGIGMHVGPDGRLVRAGNGRHRFAMAWILQLPAIPVRVGLVHRSSIPLLDQLRRTPDAPEPGGPHRD